MRKIPFEPFRIIMESGIYHDLLRADLMMVTRKFLLLGICEELDPVFPERIAHISIGQISEIKTLATDML